MSILGLDASLNGTAVAYFYQRDLCSTRIPVKSLKGVPRLYYVREKLRPHLDGIEYVFMEDYAFSRGKVGMVFNIGEMGGVLKTLCYELGIGVVLVPPTSLKLFATGKGKAPKGVNPKVHMAKGVEERFGRTFDSDDECDAYALLEFGRAYFSGRKRRAYPERVRDAITNCVLTHGKIET